MEFQLILKTDNPEEVSNILRAFISTYKKGDSPQEVITKMNRVLRDPDTGEHRTIGEKPSEEIKKGQLKCADPKCGKLFTPPTKKSIYCSNKCYQRSYWHLHSKLQNRDQFTQPEKPANSPAKDDNFHKKLEILKEKGIAPIPQPKIKRDFQS